MIYYTTDGTTPTSSSAKYSAPVQISATQTLSAIAIAPSEQPSAVATAAYTINVPAPTFTLSASLPSAISPGGAAVSTITITPSGGFTGTVALSCAVTGSPTGAVDVPTCSATAPGAISGSAVTATVTVTTTAASTSSLAHPFPTLFTLGGGSALAALLLFGLPARRRKWQTLFGLLLLVGFAGLGIGCGGGPTSNGTPKPGTTAGSYTVTVTGTSGETTASTTVKVTVN